MLQINSHCSIYSTLAPTPALEIIVHIMIMSIDGTYILI